MDEILAKGFSKQFLTWLNEDLIKTRVLAQKLVDKMQPFAHRNNFMKFAEELKKIYSNLSLNFLIGGSERRPFIAFVSFSSEENEYETWEEKELIPSTIIYLNNEQMQPVLSPFTVSEHALKRIYQRANIKIQEIEKNHYAIINEMSLIPLWASFWAAFKTMTDTEDLSLNVYIPGIEGLFLIKMENLKYGNRIHVRTYLGPNDLSDDQVFIRDTLKNAGTGFENSLLSFFPSSWDKFPGQCTIDFDLILYRLKKNNQNLSRIFLSSDDEVEASILNRKITAILKTKTTEYFEELNQLLTKYGYRIFAKEINKIAFKAMLKN
jgi:hypothetical protein